MQPTLYHMPYCPYCQRVVHAIDRLKLDVILVDINEDPEARALLWQERGRATVPVLEIPNAAGTALMGESLDIIEWLETNAASLKKAS